MKPLRLFCLCLLASLFLIAQPDEAMASTSEPIQIGILRFQDVGRPVPTVTTSIEQFIYSKFVDLGRFQVIERSRLDAIEAERFIQQMNNVQLRTELADLGAFFIVLGEVTQAEVVRRRLEGGGETFDATVAYGLRVLDVSTGQVLGSRSFTNRRQFISFSPSSPAAAIEQAIQQTSRDVDAFLISLFPVEGVIVSVESTRNLRRGRLEVDVLVSLGAADGVNQRSRLQAFLEEEVRVGQEILNRRRGIAELRFQHHEGDRLSVFRTRRNGEELLSALERGEVKVEFLVD